MCYITLMMKHNYEFDELFQPAVRSDADQSVDGIL